MPRSYRIRPSGARADVTVTFPFKPQIEPTGNYVRANARDAEGTDVFVISLDRDTFSAAPVMQSFSKVRKAAALEAVALYKKEHPEEWGSAPTA